MELCFDNTLEKKNQWKSSSSAGVVVVFGKVDDLFGVVVVHCSSGKQKTKRRPCSKLVVVVSLSWSSRINSSCLSSGLSLSGFCFVIPGLQ